MREDSDTPAPHSKRVLSPQCSSIPKPSRPPRLRPLPSKPTASPPRHLPNPLCSLRHRLVQFDRHSRLAKRHAPGAILLHAQQQRLHDHDMLANPAILGDLQHGVLTQHLLGGDVDDGVPLDIRVVDDMGVTMWYGRGGGAAREMGDDAVDGGGEAHVRREVHGGHDDGVVEAFPACFRLGGDLGEEVGQGGEEVFGDGGCEPGLLRLKAVDPGEGL